MEEGVGVAETNSVKTELVDIVYNAVGLVLLWFLISLSNVRLISCWFIESLATSGRGLWSLGSACLTSKLPEISLAVVAGCVRIRILVARIPGLLLYMFIQLYDSMRQACSCCMLLCQSLHHDAFCLQVQTSAAACLTWLRRHCYNRHGCHHLYGNISRHVRAGFHLCGASCQSYCPTLSTTVTRCWATVARSPVTTYLGYATATIFRVSVACLLHTWVSIVRVYMYMADGLIHQILVLSKRLCQTEATDDATRNIRTARVCTVQDIQECADRLGCPMFVTRWRFSLLRFSPRSGFIAILVFVVFTFLVTAYIYSGNVVNMNEHNKHSRGQEQQTDLSLRHGQGRPHADVDKHEARFAGQWKRHKNQHRRKEDTRLQEDQLNTPKMKQVQNVISLMSKLRSSNETSTLGIQKKVLRGQIRLLREAMTSEHTMLPKPVTPPACVGNLQPGEVEDILCIPRPKFLSYIKNPCWHAENPSAPGGKSLQCLPYFHILGCAKSGTTDLWNRLMSHPHTVSNDGLLHKEALWWSWYRYGLSGYNRNREVQNFSSYISLFQDTARQIQSSIDQETLFHQILITGDASPPDFWDFRGWVNISQNRLHTVPSVITPHLMRHIYADPKFIVMFRDPIDRLYSDYFFVGLGLTSQDFHDDILASVDMLARCVEQRGLPSCFHDLELYVKLPVRLPFACYSVFMREWLQVFPLENFLFIKTEEYQNNLEDTLKSVMEFLGLGPLKDTQLQVIAEEERSRITLQRKIAGPMQNATRDILEELLGACNTELARLIKSDKFTWAR